MSEEKSAVLRNIRNLLGSPEERLGSEIDSLKQTIRVQNREVQRLDDLRERAEAKALRASRERSGLESALEIFRALKAFPELIPDGPDMTFCAFEGPGHPLAKGESAKLVASPQCLFRCKAIIAWGDVDLYRIAGVRVGSRALGVSNGYISPRALGLITFNTTMPISEVGNQWRLDIEAVEHNEVYAGAALIGWEAK